MTEFKKFKVSKFFDIHPTRSYKLTNRKLMNPNGKSPVLTNTSTNNGIGGWSNLKPTENQLMITFSDTTTGADTMFVQNEPFIGYSHVQGMYPKPGHSWTVTELLYVIVALKASAGDGWSYATKFNRKIVSNLDILLPVTPSGDPDFAYMTRYIQDLEAQRIQDLEAQRIQDLDAYLKVSGLDNTVLTDQEKEALTKKVEWKKFRIGDLFERIKLGYTGTMFDVQKDVSKEKNSEFDLPVVSVMTTQNGIMYYGRSSEWSSIENSIDIVQNGVKATGSVFYQPQATSSFRDAYLVKFKQGELTREESLFMVTALKAVLPKTFSRERLATWTRVQNAHFSLPVQSDGAIDFAYMQDYITALEKLNIKDVVAYKDKVITATKQIVSQQS